MSIQEDNNQERQLALDFIRYTNRNVFLTGNAGTGKTTFLQQLKDHTGKRMIIVAPTGVAAINAGGVTIHSFFQISFGPQLPDASHAKDQRFSREKINIIRTLDLLVIDEISMVRADLLDAIDRVLRRFRFNNKPFGGVQLLMIGDLQQLAPVVKDDEWSLLRNYYDSMYFFSSIALRKTDYVGIELKRIYRQKDELFIGLLNAVRNNTMDKLKLNLLNSRCITGFLPGKEEGYVTLTTHNHQARRINDDCLARLPEATKVYKAKVDGEFPEHAWPADFELRLKVGAQVIFIKNDPGAEKLFFNGKTGKIVGIDKDVIFVKCGTEEDSIAVEPLVWHNTRYSLNEETGQITENIIGSFKQYPLKLAWAITIHKSQGLTFDKAVVDAHAAFAHGQVYVALSRCRSLEGLILSTPVSEGILTTDRQVTSFNQYVRENEPGEKQLLDSRIKYQEQLLEELFDFKGIEYLTGKLHQYALENKTSLDSSLPGAFAEMSQMINHELTQVSSRFSREMDRLLREGEEPVKNGPLQERIRKACGYFSEKLQKVVIRPSEALSTDSDNKAVRKLMDDTLEKLLNLASIKLACLDCCKSGFRTEQLVEARARASIEKSVRRKSSRAAESTENVKSEHPELLKTIRRWRDALAKAHKIPVAQILPRVTMVEITNVLPANEKQLLSISGIGKVKMERYGRQLLELISMYCRERNIPQKEDQIKEKKKPTFGISLEMYRQGLSAEEIALARGLARTTIEGHLAAFVKTGEINLEELVEPEKGKMIQEYFLSVDDYHLSPAREVLGEQVSFSELRYVLNHLIFTGELDHKESFREFLGLSKHVNEKND